MELFEVHHGTHVLQVRIYFVTSFSCTLELEKRFEPADLAMK